MEEEKEVETGPALSTITPRGKIPLLPHECQVFEDCLAKNYESTSTLQLSTTHLPGVYYIDNVLTSQECDALVQEIDKNQNISFWCLDKKDDPSTRSYRNAETIEMHSDTFANLLWSRVAHIVTEHLPQVEIKDDQDDSDFERDLVGKWIPVGANPDSLFARYPHFGHFAPHTDGRAVIDFNRRSHYTIVLFLNSVPVGYGAGTRFYDAMAVDKLQLLRDEKSQEEVLQWTASPELLKGEVDAVAGRMVLFHQAWVHEGVPPVSPYKKYIIRSDVIFQRDPPVCDSPQDREAYKLFREAEELAESGDNDKAIPLFRKAFRMSPVLARMMGQA